VLTTGDVKIMNDGLMELGGIIYLKNDEQLNNADMFLLNRSLSPSVLFSRPDL